MKIKPLYDIACSKSEGLPGAIVYKFNKFLVNIFYPLFGKPQNGIDADSKIIISVTSWTARINKVHLTVISLLNQTVKPNKIILWLAKDQFPDGNISLPKKLTRLERYGLEIRYCDDLKPHKKYYYAMKEYPEYSIITVDDDVFYPEDTVEKLVKKSTEYPGVICCNWCHRFVLDDNEDVYSYDKWETRAFTGKPGYSCIPVGVGGVLYPPHSLHQEVFNEKAIKELCLTVDDFWLKAMAVYNHTKSVRTDGQNKIYFTIMSTKKTGLYNKNVGENKSKAAWSAIMNEYDNIRELLISEIKKENY